MADVAFIDLAWTIWHEGVRIYDDSFPGHVRSINGIRSDAAGKQSHNNEAQNRINNLSNNEIENYIPQITDQIMSTRQLGVHFNWVALHEGKRKNFLDSLANSDFASIRSTYYNAQNHNPDARELLAGLSNRHLKDLIDAL
ncbi:MAG: hypothetical protein EOS07_35685 [Mesorhizobium sp.]|nr:MAG: hypothetical protein EOS07_35685 [Mesorhizobium sp.]